MITVGNTAAFKRPIGDRPNHKSYMDQHHPLGHPSLALVVVRIAIRGTVFGRQEPGQRFAHLGQAEFLEAVADGLDALALEALASEVHGWTAAGGSPDAIEDGDLLAPSACLKAAILTNAPRTAEAEESASE